MKKHGFSFAHVLAALAMVALLVCAAVAGDVYERSQITLGSTGTNTWTNANLYASIELKRFEVIMGLYQADTITVSRITAGDTYVVTNTVTGLLLATGGGSSNLVNAANAGPFYMEYGDKLKFSSGNGSNATVNIEYIVEKH